MTSQPQQIVKRRQLNMDLLGESVSDGRYEVKTQLGRGSMGYVYCAFDRNLETEVVLKVPTLARLENPDFRKRFLQESRFLVRLTHPSIISILDVGEYDEIPYFVMQYVSGGSLEDRLYDKNKVKQKLDVESLRAWLPSISTALDFMHSKSCIHRDVKPANILFDAQGNAFLSDFGLSKVIMETEDEDHSSMTAAGAVVGTPSYVAPEIVLGRDYDGRADQYSLATTVYELLTAHVPMEGPNASATIVNQTTKKLANPQEFNPAITIEVARVIVKGMAKRQEDRFESCVEFSNALFAAIDLTNQPKQGSGQRAPARYIVKATSKGKKGKVPCPGCKKVLVLLPQYAGKKAKCSKCSQMLVIGKNLKELQLIEREMGEDSYSSSQDEMTKLVGQELFGLKLSPQQAIIALMGLVVVAVVAVLVMFFKYQQSQNDEEDKKNRARTKIKMETSIPKPPANIFLAIHHTQPLQVPLG